MAKRTKKPAPPTVSDILLRKGYFPKELPPPFGTASLATAIKTGSTGIMSLFLSEKKRWTQICGYSFARPSRIRRRLSIPNPLSMTYLTDSIDRNYSDINNKIKRSHFTLSGPVRKPGLGRAFTPGLQDGSLPDSRAERRSAGKYLVQADIANFYPSVYTHSIPWSIEGRSAVKARLFPPRGTPRGVPTYGDELDEALRNGNSGQTVGLPIGPDTSLILAELLLSDVDQRMDNEAKPAAGMRYYDDYELTYRTAAEAENGLSVAL